MKKLLTIAIILIAVIVCARPVSKVVQQKKYPVYLTLEEWQAVVSSVDSKRASKLLEDQLIPQIQKEQDSLKVKKP